ncbi:hypothetical protein BDW74DRAFT_116268 [Aspergillus multicolor]|uniref:uncharacterized protein n=1 Tax=Aspergillus multicolor TaxID=41759 RepID=UPI003CCD3331
MERGGRMDYRDSMEFLDPAKAEESLRLPVDEQCRLYYNPPICIVVVIAGLAKAIVMFLSARTDPHGRSPPLLPVGDTVASFLSSPDLTTGGMCTIPRNNCEETNNLQSISCSGLLQEPRQWLYAASLRRWIAAWHRR